MEVIDQGWSILVSVVDPHSKGSSMTTPITGPFIRSQSYKGPPTSLGYFPTHFYRTSTWYRQRKPYNLPLRYEARISCVTSFKSSIPSSYVVADNTGNLYAPNPDWDWPKAKAWSKLKEDIGDASLWAVNLIEYKQSLDLITSSATTLWKFTRALHKFDFFEAARILRVAVPKGLKPKAKAFGNNFLKFHFGVEPLCQDIGAAVKTLEAPIPSKKVSGRASTRSTGQHVDGTTGALVKWTFKNSAKQGCTVKVSNPNLYLASQLGFVNPAAIAWELVPFSFVVDWFVNVGDFLNSFTDLYGLEIIEPYSSILNVGNGVYSGIYPGVPISSLSFTLRNVYSSRTTNLEGPTVRVRPWKGVSPVRAATAISLLVQQLK